MNEYIGLALFIALAAALFVWLRNRKKNDRIGVPGSPAPTPPPIGGRPGPVNVDWDTVWRNAIASGMSPDGPGAEGLKATIRSYLPNWNPPE